MFVAFSLLKDGIDNVALSLNSINYENARVNATSCLEDTLLRIKREDQFDTNLSYVFDEDESCQTTIAWLPPVPAGLGVTEAQVDLQVIGHSKGFNRRFEYELLIRQHDVNHLDGSLTYTNNINIVSVTELTN